MLLGSALALIIYNLSVGTGSEGEIPKVDLAQYSEESFQEEENFQQIEPLNTEYINVQLQTEDTFEKNEPIEFLLSLQNAVGEPIESEDLMTMHSEKIHLFIIDPSLSDYFHEHPASAGLPGDYQFSITPHKSGDYKVFIELTPSSSASTQYIPGLISIPGEPELLDRNDSPRAGAIQFTQQQAGLTFTARIDRFPIKANKNNQLWITVTDPEGLPITNLEPIMGAFGHIAGFTPQLTEIDHLHPVKPIPQSLESRAGPNLLFNVNFSEVGFHRLFVQVQVDGEKITVPFDVIVI